MYKVEKYKFISDTTDNFMEGKIYYLRRAKGGMSEYLTTEKDDYELKVSSEKISLIADYNKRWLEENFQYIGRELYNNYKDFKNTLGNI